MSHINISEPIAKLAQYCQAFAAMMDPIHTTTKAFIHLNACEAKIAQLTVLSNKKDEASFERTQTLIHSFTPSFYQQLNSDLNQMIKSNLRPHAQKQFEALQNQSNALQALIEKDKKAHAPVAISEAELKAQEMMAAFSSNR